MNRWITDTEPSERFPLYTRGNADEVGPEPFPPLTWTLAWEQATHLGVADAWVHLGGFREDEFQAPVPEVFGSWGGYFYNQVSIGRVFSVRISGSPDAIDQAYFGDRADIPPYVADPRDADPERSARLAETVGWIMSTDSVPYLDEFVAKVREWQAARPDLAALSDAELVAYGRAANHRLRETWDVYAQVVIAAAIGPGAIQAITAGLGRPELAVDVFTAIGGIETAKVSAAVWALSRTIRGSGTLTAAFDAGLDGLLDRLADLGRRGDEDAQRFRRDFEALLADYGHRGPNEWDLMPETWLTRPELVLGLVDQVRRQGDEGAPELRVREGAARRQAATAQLRELVKDDPETAGTVEAALRSGTLFYRAREAGKDASVRVMLEAKLPFFELGRRMSERGAVEDPKDVFMLLESELDPFIKDTDVKDADVKGTDVKDTEVKDIGVKDTGVKDTGVKDTDVNGAGTWRDTLAERRREFASLAEREPPYIVRHGVPVPPIDTWPVRNRAGTGAPAAARGDVLNGIAASPGTVTGRARVVFDLAVAKDVEPGDILVCGTTDPSWVPLFLVAGGVVSEVGALGSHAAIVSRELGVPCVVSVPQARGRIVDGSTVTVDGERGTVAIT